MIENLTRVLRFFSFMSFLSGQRQFHAPLVLLLLLATAIPVTAQEQTVGLFQNEEAAFDGYTLFAPNMYTTTYLIDNEGRLVHQWESEFNPGASAYLLDNGHLLRTVRDAGNPNFTVGGAGGRVQEFDWDGNLVWEFAYSNEQHRSHHDIEKLPNGNVLMIAWELKTAEEAIAAGRDTSLLDDDELWPDHIIEVEPLDSTGGNIVWEWHIWDHLIQDYDSTKANYGVIADHPELVDFNFVLDGRADWLHFNAIAYNAELDQIVVCSPTLNEIWVIDHSTTTAEAASHEGGNSGKGGDLLYRWGNPRAYRRGTSADQKFFFQHDAHWIASGLAGAGNILVFNNGRARPEGDYSSVDEIVPPVDANGNYFLAADSAYGPAAPVWTYTAENPTDFWSSFISGAQRLPNGNTLICSGANGTFFEVTATKEIVWKYVNPVINTGPVAQGDTIPIVNKRTNGNIVFRAYRYAPDFPGFAGRDLTPGDPIELAPTAVHAREREVPTEFVLQQNYPNPFNPTTHIAFRLPQAAEVTLAVYNALGQRVAILAQKQNFAAGYHSIRFEATRLSSGIYLYRLSAGDFAVTKKMMVLR